MLQAASTTRELSTVQRLLAVSLFAALTVASAKVSIGYPVPFTLQTMVVLLAGYVLGARDGALSQVFYLGMIALNLPVDARSLGQAALLGPTAGFLVGFPLAAYVAGWLAEHNTKSVGLRWLAGLAGMLVIFALGMVWFKVSLGRTWQEAWTLAVLPFLLGDMLKALLAAAVAEGGRSALRHYGMLQG